jgi:pimeloyl-ACP methyl ester carboxylesterase
MKRILIALFLIATFSAKSQEIIGQWYGKLAIQGTELRIVFNISTTENGYTSTMDSPDQGAKGIPVKSTNYENGILKIEMPNIKLEYSGELKSGTIAGNLKQNGMSFPMNLSKEAIQKRVAIRPQEPKKPYPYYSEDITFENKKDNITLAGTLSLPKKEGAFPVVLLISGSGPQNRDEELLGHKPFLVLSDYLTRNGIAVLRFDDRGTALSEGNFKSATSLDFASDVEAGIQYLKTRKEIKNNKIGLIGHSEGGMIAPIIASKSKDVDFIVLLAGTGVTGEEILLLQQELIGRVSGISEKDLLRSKNTNKGAFEIVKKATSQEEMIKELTFYFEKIIKETPETEKPKEVKEEEYVKMMVDELSNPWMQFFIKYNPAVSLDKVKCPVLAINGEKDLQVPAKINLEAIKKALDKGKNKKSTVMELPNLNHLFQECKSGSPEEYATIEETFSPKALEVVKNWIQNQVKK